MPTTTAVSDAAIKDALLGAAFPKVRIVPFDDDESTNRRRVLAEIGQGDPIARHQSARQTLLGLGLRFEQDGRTAGHVYLDVYTPLTEIRAS